MGLPEHRIWSAFHQLRGGCERTSAYCARHVSDISSNRNKRRARNNWNKTRSWSIFAETIYALLHKLNACHLSPTSVSEKLNFEFNFDIRRSDINSHMWCSKTCAVERRGAGSSWGAENFLLIKFYFKITFYCNIYTAHICNNFATLLVYFRMRKHLNSPHIEFERRERSFFIK